MSKSAGSALTFALTFAIMAGVLIGAYLILAPAVISTDPPQQQPALMAPVNPRGNTLDNVRQIIQDRLSQRPAQPVPAAVPAGAPPAQAAPASAPANAPLVSEQQQQQLDFAADLAAQEASQQYLEERRQAEEAAPVKMDAAQAAQEYGRDPCHAPRADPRTCGRGIPEATPLNQPAP